MKIKTKELDQYFASVLFYFFYVTILLYSILFPILIYLAALIGIICFCFVIITKPRVKTFILPFVVYSCALTSALYTENYRIEEYFMPIVYIGPSLILIFYNINLLFSKIYFYFVSALYLVVLAGIVDANIMEYFSDNYISINMINALAIYYIARSNNKKKFTIWPSLVVSIICFLSKGRAAIIAGITQLLLFILYYLWEKKKIRRKKILASIFLMIVISIIIYNFTFDKYIFPLLSNFYSTSKFDYGFTSVGRSLLLTEYLSKANSSLLSIIFGVPSRKNTLFLAFGSNWHNSYLRLHSFFGISGVLLVLIFSFRAGICFYKRNRVYFILMMVILLRILTDSAAFNGIFDPILYYFFYYGSTVSTPNINFKTSHKRGKTY